MEGRRKGIPVHRNSLNKIKKYFKVCDVFKKWSKVHSKEAHGECQHMERKPKSYIETHQKKKAEDQIGKSFRSHAKDF